MRFKEELTLSLLCKQTGRATRPLSPLKMKDAFQFQFVPTDENNLNSKKDVSVPKTY